MKRVDAILCSDLHLRLDSPICRTDNFLDAQTKKYQFLQKLQKQYNCPVLIAGDIFDRWKPSPELISYAIDMLPNNCVAIAGQHDLEAHNLDNIRRSGIHALAKAGKLILLGENETYEGFSEFDITGCPWGTDLSSVESSDFKTQIALIHYGVYESKPHYFGAEVSGGTAKSLMKKMPNFDCLVTGDNHLNFSVAEGKQLLCNSGSLLRTSASQVDHQPSVYLWCAETNEVERVYIPIEQGVISREHISSVEERDERLEAFISKLDHNMEITVNFKCNLERHLAQNQISKETTNIIWECAR